MITKPIYLTIRISDKDKKRIKADAEAANLNLSKYILSKLLDTPTPIKEDIPTKVNVPTKQSVTTNNATEKIFTFKCKRCGDRYTKQNPHHLCPKCDNIVYPENKS